ncbi:TolC family protein [Desulfobulbus rhabdoformis]|uniref:TolC family protein n=1 Tax=Desulfobulbus rhabdoformis TaxID=34032 RepID=UPI00196296D9|nr:TolC family protein [Desulfobulbus rhabdoformis]MBM9615191.1 TolC family protein [Desulfobulbus rhabdoformis]
MKQIVRCNVFMLMTILTWVAWPSAALSKAAIPEVEGLVTEALEHNPDLKASEEQWQIMLARAEQAGALDDPIMMVGIQNGLLKDPLSFDQSTMTAKVIGISQKIPFYGKRDLMKMAARQGAEAEHWLVAERRLTLQRLIKANWARLYRADRSLETVQKTLLVLEDLIGLAESMYSVGTSPQQDVFQVQLQRSKMEEMRILLVEQRKSLSTLLNSLAARSQTTLYPTLPRLKPKNYVFAPDQLEQLALNNRPILKALHARIEKSDTGIRLAQRDFYPDFTVSLEYMQREPTMSSAGDDMYGAKLSFNLPIQRDRRSAKVTEMEAERRKGVWDREERKNQIRQALSEALARLERSQKLIRLYRQGILAQAEGAAESALAGYRSGESEFSKVLAARMLQFDNERAYHSAVADQQMQLAILEEIVGGELPKQLGRTKVQIKRKMGN